MKFRGDKKYIYWGLTAVIVICSGILFYYAIFNWSNLNENVKRFFKIIMPLVDGAVLAYLLSSITNFLEDIIYNKIWKKHNFIYREKRIIRVLTIFITYIIVFWVLYEFFRMVIPELYSSIVNISIQFPNYVNNLEIFITKTLQKNPEMETLLTNVLDNYSDPINDWLNKTVIPRISSMFVSVTNGIFIAVKSLWNLIIGFIISVYLLYNKEIFKGQAKKIVYAFMERNTANTFIYNMRFTNKTFGGFIIGKIVDSIIMGLLCLAVTKMLHTPYDTLISVIIGVTNIIPFFGPFIGAIPSALLVLMIDPKAALYFVIAILILQQFDGNFIGPKILGNSTGISGFWVIFAITLFGGFFGVLGMLVGVPLFAVLYAGIRSYIKAKLQAKNLEFDTMRYITVDYINENNEFIEIPKEEIKDVKSKKNLNKLKERLKFEKTLKK